MLQTIRDRLSGWVAFLLLGLIAVALVISFGNMSTDVSALNSAATVNGEDISMTRFQELYQNQLLRQQQAFQGELPEVLQQQIRTNVLESLVQNRVVSQYARERGYRMDDNRLAQYIRSQEAFKVDGEFSPQSYTAILASQAVSPEAYEEDQRNALEIGQIQAGIIASAFYTPAEYRRFIELQLENRVAKVARLDPVSLLDEIEVAETEVRSFYENTPSRFQTEESVALEYIEVQLAEFAASVAVGEDELRAYYESNLGRYRTEEERRARHILIAESEERDAAAADTLAAEIQGRLEAGETFAELAATYSDDTGSAADGGDLGWAGRGVFVPEFEDAVYALQINQVSAPVRTQFGIHLIQVLEVREGSQQPFEEVKAELREELQSREAEDGYYELAERLDDLALESPGGLESAAQGTGLAIQRAELITRAGGAPFGFNQALIEAAFSVAVLEDGENSALIELGDGQAIVIRVAEYREPVLKAFDEVKAEIEQELRLQAAASVARQRGEDLLERAQAGEDLAAAADEVGTQVGEPLTLARGSDVLPPDVVAEIFRARPPVNGVATVSGFASGDGSYTVFALEEVQAGRPESIPRAERDQRKGTLAQQVGNYALGAMILDLRAQADVQVSPNTINPEENP
ncbi:MAG: SurA N-terminal domain-containing protein [Gammaproteobacteria bacterium]